MNDNDYVIHDETIPVKNVSKPNNIIGAHIVEGKGESFYDWVDTYNEWNGYYHSLLQQKRMNQGAHTRLWAITTSLQSQKSSTTGS